ncbi:MAG: hypothetical protein ABI823_15870 [Bryobacteraceae bacterium]
MDQFRNPAGSQPKRPAFRFPFDPAPRTTILLDGFRETASTRVFPGGWCESAARLNPEAVAGPLPRLKALAEASLEGRLAIPSLDRAVIVLERLSGDWSIGRTLTARDRDLLWRAFRVPIYVQYIGISCELLASECEAYSGAHIADRAAQFSVANDGRLLVTPLHNTAFPVLNLATGIAAEIDPTRCPCGLTSPRLRGLRAFVPAPARARAAIV